MGMKTVIIQIGNSDDKLSQVDWSCFIRDVDVYLECGDIHFFGTSIPTESHQNACWVVNIEDEDLEKVKLHISDIGLQYEQDTIAWTEGITEFI